jgi:hypothetical protein
VTGEIYLWTNPAGKFPKTIGDNQAFDCVDPGGTPDCTRDAMTACLLDSRFKVTGTMRDNASPPNVFPTQVMQFAQQRAETDQAVFNESFNAGNFEVGVKMVDGCAAFPVGHPLHFYWIFYGGLTNAATEVRAVHVPTGRVDIWRNPPGTLPTSVGRNKAFPCS